MENASKALIIAGAILLAISIIAIGMFVVRNVTGAITDSADMSSEQADAYNSPFLSYEGNIRGSRAKTLCNSVRGHNLAAKDDSEKIGVFTDDKGADYAAGQTAGTTTAEINNVNSGLQSGKTYTVSFGMDPDSGYITAIYIVEAD